MKEGIHPDYREVVFADLQTGSKFITRSTVQTRETIELDGKTYPLFKRDVTSESHPFYTGAQTRIVETGRVESSAPSLRAHRRHGQVRFLILSLPSGSHSEKAAFGLLFLPPGSAAIERLALARHSVTVTPVSPLSISTPARLTSVATAKLPRLVLLGLALAYIVAGLFMRDPWKTDDAVGLATMITAIREGGITWLLPQVGHLAHAEEGPLITWVGAISIWIFGPFIGDITAGRLPNLLWFGITASSVWYGTYLLGRRSEAQPLALPFGGEPPPRDYGRMLADAALLLLLATVGILQRTHETTVIPAIMACQALAFYSLARSIDRPLTGATTLAIALAASFLTRGWIGAIPIMAGALLTFYPRSQLWRRKRWLPWIVLLTAALILAWWIPATQGSEYWIRNWKIWNLSSFAGPDLPDMGRTLRDLPWYLWPAWPLALLAVWRWRAWIYAPHIWVPLMLLISSALLLFGLAEPSDSEYALLAVPCAVLAAFSLPTLRRGVVNTLDWFAVMCFR